MKIIKELFYKLIKIFYKFDVRNSMKSNLLVNKRIISSKLVEFPEEKNVLVLAPHMDDEVIGCGGTLYKHIMKGAEITVVYLTDGRKGNPALNTMNISKAEREKYEDALINVRKEEAHKAAKIIGYKDLIFLDYPDSCLTSKKDTIEAVKNIFHQKKPEVVYLPFLTDQHPDHWQTNCIFVNAVKDFSASCNCCGYEVWSPLYPNYMVNITDVIEIKENALREFNSQLQYNDYIHSIKGLNAFRAMLYIKAGYCEAFYRCSVKEYINLYENNYGDTL